MKYSSLVKSILTQFTAPEGNRVVPFLVGEPGGGKSSCAREIAHKLQEMMNIPDERVVEFNPSLREPSDILGLPSRNGDYCKWLPAEEFYRLRHGVGPCVLIIEELSDATMDIQNPLCRVILDRYAGNLRLSDDLYIIATGNRTKDKSGACRLSTKLGNRMRIIQFESDLKDWLKWASNNGINPVLQAFVSFRSELLSKFDPNQSSNPTPRSWEDVNRIPLDLPDVDYYEHVAGSVGSGAALEYTGFLKIFRELEDINVILKTPSKAKVSHKPDVIYATCAKLATVTTKDNFKNVLTYLKRLPADQMMNTILLITRNNPELEDTQEFSSVLIENQELII